MTESTEQTTPTNGGGLASLKLAQLQALASQLGIAGGSRMRKADLVTAISDHQRGGSVADRDAAERAAQAPAAPAAEAVPAAGTVQRALEPDDHERRHEHHREGDPADRQHLAHASSVTVRKPRLKGR